MPYGLKTEASFDGAHFLTDYYGKCENLHGHRWRVVAYLRQPSLQDEGTMRDMVIDFGVFKRALRSLVAELDHSFLVEEGSLKPGTIRALEEDEGFSLSVLPYDGREPRPLLRRPPPGGGHAGESGRRVRDPAQLRLLLRGVGFRLG